LRHTSLCPPITSPALPPAAIETRFSKVGLTRLTTKALDWGW
jgi:hypothetical protein